MMTGSARIAASPPSFGESYQIDAICIRFDQPLNPLLLCSILASPVMMCVLSLTWLAMR